MGLNPYSTLRVSQRGKATFITFDRVDAGNAINAAMVDDFGRALARCREESVVVVLEGAPDVFCIGADFAAIAQDGDDRASAPQDPRPLYEVWRTLATGPFVTVAHVRGRTNAGGVGFAAACDIVVADDKATFALLFGLLPACVLPFLIRRIGAQRAKYMTLMTQPVDARTAHEWGLVDAYAENSEQLLRKHLLRLGCLTRKTVSRYKQLDSELDGALARGEAPAVRANLDVFSDVDNIAGIRRYVESGLFPWE